MKIIDEIINENVTISKYLDIFNICNDSLDLKNIANDEVIFFDIETTGLNVLKTNLYLIGYVYFKEDAWHYCQLFGTSPKEEKELLLAFKEVCSSYKYLIHFNGDHFDVPYINTKCTSNDIPIFLDNLISIDIYTLVRMYKSHLGLTNCKQKTIENLLNVTREDKFNGGELIFQYFDYVKSKDTKLERNLLLHNAEDCIGMLKLLEITDYIKLVNYFSSGCYDIDLELNPKNALSNHEFEFSFKLISKDTDFYETINTKLYCFRNYNICINDDNTITFNCNLYEGTLKHFFSDIQNYYYIPEKDMAMHKTVAKYIDPSEREKAKVSTCYVKKKGIFIPIFAPAFDVLNFKHDSKDTNNFLLFISDEGEINIDVNELKISLKSSLTNIGK